MKMMTMEQQQQQQQNGRLCQFCTFPKLVDFCICTISTLKEQQNININIRQHVLWNIADNMADKSASSFLCEKLMEILKIMDDAMLINVC
mmetsp:Transcript_11503/g.15144  ORF Transcript_11503/g.15144 Transcript_11503/m.15144 type:complete len:90 (+) Transcript_11503:67-336(+)